MVNLAQALDLLFDRLGGLGTGSTEQVPLRAASERILAADIVPGAPVPSGPRSAMDGFAVHRQDAGAASLRVAGRVLAGEAPPALRRGETVFVATGAPLPETTGAVVPREWAEWDAAGADPAAAPPPGATVRIRVPAAPGANVIVPGELLPAGHVALRAGARLSPAAIGLLAALGRASVPVRRAPLVCVLATGDELLPPGQPAVPGASYESNAPMLEAACRAAGAEVRVLPPVRDDLEVLGAALRAALRAGPTLVLSTGGVSVGPADLVPAAWRALGADEVFWRVAIKPGRPVFAALLGPTAVLGLSGSPAACWTAFNILAGPLLGHWAGARHPFPAPQRARLAEGIAARADVPRLLWSEVGPGPLPVAWPTRRRTPGTLAHLARANALVIQPAGSGPLPAGAEVWALRTDRVGEAGEADARALLSAAAHPARAAEPRPGLPPGPRPAGATPADPAVPRAAASGGDAAAGPRPAVCAVGGRSGHGKTTLIEGLIAVFGAAGEPVATLKHHGHGAPLDAPGKDGFRHRAAGARLTIVSGAGGFLWSEAAEGDVPAESWLPALRERAGAAGCRWLLVEGYHQAVLPRVEVLDTERSPAPSCTAAEGLFLVAASDPRRAQVPAGVAVVARDDVRAIADAIRRACPV